MGLNMGPDIGQPHNPDASVSYQYTGTPAAGPVETPAPGQVQYEQSQSTISKSEAEQELIQLFLAMQIPFLTPPSDVQGTSKNGVSGIEAAAISKADVQWIDLQYEKAKSDIINTMWEQFSKSVRELEELAKKDYIKKWSEDVTKAGPKSSTEYFAYILALSAGQRAQELDKDSTHSDQSVLGVQFGQAYQQWFVDPGVVASRNGGFPDPSFVAGALASSPDALRAAIGGVGLVAGVEVTKQLSVSPIADAVLSVGPSTGLPVDSQAAAAMIAALLYQGGVNRANAETLKDALKSGVPPQNMDFALNFSKNILAIVTHPLKGEDQLDPQRQQQNKMIRLMLSVMALNLLYRQTFGGMEGRKEFADLLKQGGTTDLLKGLKLDPEVSARVQSMFDGLVAQIQKNLPSDAEARASMIVSLGEYIDSKDSVNSMLSTTMMLASSLGVDPDILHQRIMGTTT